VNVPAHVRLKAGGRGGSLLAAPSLVADLFCELNGVPYGDIPMEHDEVTKFTQMQTKGEGDGRLYIITIYGRITLDSTPSN